MKVETLSFYHTAINVREMRWTFAVAGHKDQKQPRIKSIKNEKWWAHVA